MMLNSMKSKKLNLLSFWAINDALDIDGLKRQLLEIKLYGMEGVVFHPRYYPGEPKYLSIEYMNILSELIEYAKEIDMIFWIYDENGWPSGSADGQVIKKCPNLRKLWLELFLDDTEISQTDEVLHRFESNGKWYKLILKSVMQPSPMSKKAVKSFIEITHERYRKLLKKDAFEYIEGFFTDEVCFPIPESETVSEYGTIPWCETMASDYFLEYGEDILPTLPSLFFKIGDYKKTRVQYWELAIKIINEAFYKQLDAWGQKYSKRMTGHLKGEESPVFQLPYTGSCVQILKNIMIPGIDALERDAGNNFYPRLACSVANQFGDGECLAEAFGGSGWGICPDDIINYCDWLTSHGLNNIVFHINQYVLKSKAIRDWPPSFPCHIAKSVQSSNISI